MQELPESWREMSAYHRDILFTVYQSGGHTGTEIFDIIGECDGRAKDTRFYDRLNELNDRGYLRSESAENTPGNAKTWHVTVKADLLVETVTNRWREL